MVTPSNNTPQNMDDLKEKIAKSYNKLSGRLQQVADFVIDNPSIIALEVMSSIAEQAKVPISTFSRFAKMMGFDGFSAMQILFKNQYVKYPRDYKERVQQIIETHESAKNTPQMIFNSFTVTNVEAMQKLDLLVSPNKLERAVSLMHSAKTIYIEGIRRAYPVAFYFWYALMKSHKNVVLLDNLHGMLPISAERMDEKDVFIAVTYSPHADETIALIKKAYKKKTPVICITDNQVTEFGSKIEVCFEVEEGEIMGFRSLSCSMSLAQSLAVSLIFREMDN